MSSTTQRSAKGVTRLPRWTPPGPRPAGTGEYEAGLPTELTAAVRGLAASAGHPVAAVLIAAHAKVLATVTSEPVVTAGLADGAAALAVRVEVAGGTWHDLVDRCADAPPAAGGSTETVLELSGAEPAALADDVVVRIGLTDETLRIRYRTDILTEDQVARLAGYHLTALRRATATPDEAHDDAVLLSDKEIRTQLEAFTGPRAPLDGPLFVERVEARVAAHPDALAAAHGDRRWTYRELDDRANRIANTLLAEGLRPEQVVAVVMDRTLEWAAATLGVLKAGGVYLPVRPDFPDARIATQLERSECRFVVTADPANGRHAPGATVLITPDVCDGDAPTTAPGVHIGPTQLAYVYFTSGSTGAPKGAMCEHAGMINHLYAKIDDLGFGAGDVVAQTASQCFDISLWQLVGPWLVGGSVRIVDTATQLDTDAFLDELTANDVAVAQLVPSYFEVLLTRLERGRRDLGALRCLSITGEALKIELVHRWFALYEGISLVNAYGATEVSDDTMHEVLDGPPPREFVTVGRSLRNVDTYILDERQRLVPLGSPGEIAFAGVSVGRGYINDPERTAQAFGTDPYRPGNRMYRTGDFGRWLPEGRLEFLGRRDQQVKIRGFRIEIGEIENRMLGVPGVLGAAVVLDGTPPNLVGFYGGPAGVTPEQVREHLAASLPDYMVPRYVHRLDSLPLNENGKVNKKVLAGLATPLGHGGGSHVAPRTPTERLLATVWAEVLGVPIERIGRTDDFFELGGTSLAAVRFVVRLDRRVSLADLIGNPVLSALAEVLDAATGGSGGLLHRLAESDTPALTLVCFPYAGGNAVNFQRLAKELEPHGVTVYGVELPGHDIARADDPLASVADIADRVAEEITGVVRTPLVLWGHCAGAVHALEVARRLADTPAAPHRVFTAAALLPEIDELDRETEEVTGMSNRDITTTLLTDQAYVELDGLQSERADVVGSAYRHDVVTTNEWLAAHRRTPPATRLRIPVEAVLAADDPTTTDYHEKYRSWELVAERVDLRELVGGGHYFTRTDAAAAAAAVLAALPARAYA
jgi:amino acid adenylation domain-containing protein